MISKQLLASIVSRPGIVDGLALDAELSQAGISSSELIQLALVIEDHLGVALEPEELEELSTLAAINQLLARKSETCEAS